MNRKLPLNPVSISRNPSCYLTLLQTLRSVPCLDYLTESEVEVLATAMGVVRFAHGENIYKAGEHADRMYVVRKVGSFIFLFLFAPQGSQKVGASDCDSGQTCDECDNCFQAEWVSHVVSNLAAALFKASFLAAVNTTPSFESNRISF
jgi:hypothetical protein